MTPKLHPSPTDVSLVSSSLSPPLAPSSTSASAAASACGPRTRSRPASSSSQNSHSSSPPPSSSASDESRSASETYLNDIGSPILHDPDFPDLSRLTRSQISRTYSSTDDSDSDSDDEHSTSARSRLRAIPQKSSPPQLIEIDSVSLENWTQHADDALSLEELQIDAENIASAIDALPTLADRSPPRRPRIPQSAPPLRPPPLDLRPDAMRVNGFGPNSKDHHDSDDDPITTNSAKRRHPNSRADGCVTGCVKKPALLDRVTRLTYALAAVQIATAGNAADGDTKLIAAAASRSSEMDLRREIQKLRITLDHLARLTLEQAFSVRDLLE